MCPVLRTLDEDVDIGFAITADSGELQTQAELLIQSIREIYTEAPVLIFIPKPSVYEISDGTLDNFESVATVVTGEFPIPEYPISALIRAFVEFEKRFDSEYLVAVDTDTLVLDHLQVVEGHDVWLRPADVGAQYWASEDAWEDWHELYHRFSRSVPKPFKQLTASVDRQLIPPYWNSGVVVTTDRTLPKRWLDYTCTMFEDDDLPVSTDEFFIDQISLALTVHENSVGELTERENFPLGGRLLVPDDVAVIHYGDRRNLARIVNPRTRKRLHRINALPEVEITELIYSLLVVASTKSGRILSHRQKNAIRGMIGRLIPS